MKNTWKLPRLIHRESRCVWAAALLAAAVPRLAAGEDWPQWRGPRGDGTSREQDLPLYWSEARSLAWKVDLPQWGASTPAISGDAIFVTTQHDDQLLLIRLARADGAVVWTREVGRAETPRESPPRSTQKFHPLHNNASPSPVTDGELIVVHFGNGDLAAYDFDGELLWKHNLQEEYGSYSIWWGHANSPLLFNNLVISVCMQDSLADVAEGQALSYLVAHDKRTGREKWKSQRMTQANAEECDAYTTPVLYRAAGRWELAVMGGNQLDAYDPATGEQLWFLPNCIGGRTITGPTAGHGLVFATQGMRKELLAVKAGGKGKLTRRAVVWKDADATPDTCCPVIWNDLLFTINDDGVAKCYDVETGHQQWKKRLSGKYKASPLAAEGRIYFLNLDGLTTVVAAGDRFDKLAENQLDDTTTASPAVSGGRIYIRGKKHLYAIEKR